MKLYHIILVTIAFLFSCNPINETDQIAAEKVLEVIGGKAELLQTFIDKSSQTKYNKFIDFRISDCYWINTLKYGKDKVAPYAAFHLYDNLSEKTKEEFEAVRISIDNNLMDEINNKYLYSMSELELVKNGYNNIGNYLDNIFRKDNDFKPMKFIKSKSLDKNDIDSINNGILSNIKTEELNYDLFGFGFSETGFVAILMMIEININDYQIVRFVFNKEDYKKITFIEYSKPVDNTK